MRVTRSMQVGIVIAAVVFLASCGGSHDDNNGQVVTPATDDAFITVVRQQTDTPAAQAETTEAVDISRIVATSPENTEPQAVNK